NPGTLSDGLSSICKGPKVTAETTLGWYTVIPFAALLLCIAILPLIPATERWWDNNRSKLLLALALGIPVALYITVLDGPIPVADALVEYAQFIILLLSLFVISGGIHLAGDIRANPGVNTLFLGFGAFIASFIGTTGAAMLLIRPLDRKSTRLNSSHVSISYAVFCLKK